MKSLRRALVVRVGGPRFRDGRWSWNKSTAGPGKVFCPAGQRSVDNCPQAYVEIEGGFFQERRKELVRLILNEEKLEKAEHPMERIIAIIHESDRTLVTTTGVHIARRIGRALSRAYQENF
jgi:hypothetical protein